MMRFVLLGALLLACQTAEPTKTVIRAGRLVDGSGAAAELAKRITIERGEITSITNDDDSPIASDAHVIDAREHTVLPGLINTHVHILNAGSCEAGVGVGVGPAVRNLRAMVQGGVTTAADLGSPSFASRGMRAFSGVGEGDGPRLLVAGPMLVASHGYMTNIMDGELVKLEMLRELANPEEARQVVRALAESGVDIIKLALQEFHFDATPLPMMPRDVVCAAVEEAHTQELRVVAHAVTPAAYTLALDCKVDAFVHGMLELAPPELVERLLRENIVVAPTLFAFLGPIWGPEHLDYYQSRAVKNALDADTHATVVRYAEKFKTSGEFLPSDIIPGIRRDRTELANANIRQNTSALHAHKVAQALGTDGGLCMNPLGSPLIELQQLQGAGLSPLEVLHAATQNSAKLLGLGDALGLVKPGYRADIIAVRGKPDEQLEDILNVERVLIDGREQNLDGAPGYWDIAQATARVLWTKLRD